MIKYIHGSEDSTDLDVIYVVESLPSLQECKKFCSDKIENRNICTLKNGIVNECYKGTPDEVNNAVYSTYDLHEQEYKLIITRTVDRDITVKCMRAVRIILSHLSRSQYRSIVKNALVSDWSTRINALRQINLTEIDFSALNNNMSREDILKTLAFQFGQTMLLIDGVEAYTKSSVANGIPELRQFLYRNAESDINVLETYKYLFIQKINSVIHSNVNIITDGKTEYDVISEKKI